MDTEFFENRGVDMDVDTEIFKNRGVDMDMVTEIFENRGVDMDVDTEFLENRGVDMSMDTAWNLWPPNSDVDVGYRNRQTLNYLLKICQQHSTPISIQSLQNSNDNYDWWMLLFGEKKF